MTCKIPTLVRKFAAEFLGTMILVVFGCGAALLFSPTFPLTTLTVALAFGLVIIAMAAAIGDISGCHINPAVSLAMLLDGRMGIGEFFTYLAAQFLGGIAGGGVLALISNAKLTKLSWVPLNRRRRRACADFKRQCAKRTRFKRLP